MIWGAGLKMLPTLAASLTREAVAGHDIAAVISSQYRASLREAARLAEAMMAAAPARRRRNMRC